VHLPTQSQTELQEECEGRGTKHVWGTGEVTTEFRSGNLKERDHLEDPSVDGRIILKWTFRKWDEDMEWIDLAQK
jgi:hypothetical protein